MGREWRMLPCRWRMHLSACTRLLQCQRPRHQTPIPLTPTVLLWTTMRLVPPLRSTPLRRYPSRVYVPGVVCLHSLLD